MQKSLMRTRIRNILAKTPYLWRLKDRFSGPFPGTADYWDNRYRQGGNSGAGSYGLLAQFKAEVLNRFVADNHVRSVIEFGCGDGAQLQLAQYPSYIGLDISRTAVKNCISRFSGDTSKSFFLYDDECFADYAGIFTADLAISLDVVYHLVEDSTFERYMRRLFASADRYVIVYSSNHEELLPNTHVRHRRFTDYVAQRFKQYELRQIVEQRYPLERYGADGSFAQFYFYAKSQTIEKLETDLMEEASEQLRTQ